MTVTQGHRRGNLRRPPKPGGCEGHRSRLGSLELLAVGGLFLGVKTRNWRALESKSTAATLEALTKE